jgi:hypothetical protein
MNTYKLKTTTDWNSDAAFIIKYLQFSNVYADKSSFVATVRCITKVIYIFVLLTELLRHTYCTVIVLVPSIRVVAASRAPPVANILATDSTRCSPMLMCMSVTQTQWPCPNRAFEPTPEVSALSLCAWCWCQHCLQGCRCSAGHVGVALCNKMHTILCSDFSQFWKPVRECCSANASSRAARVQNLKVS